MTISVNEFPLNNFFLDNEKTKLSPIAIQFLKALERVSTGADWSAVKAADSELLDGHDSSYFAVAGAIAQPLWDKTVTGSAVTSVTTDGEVTLSGLSHGGYRFEWTIYNPAGGTTIYRMYLNNDTTNGNYNTRGSYAGSGSGNVNAADADFTVTGVSASGNIAVIGDIIVMDSGLARACYLAFRSDGLHISETLHPVSALSGGDLTRIDIVASVASKIDVNSRFRLWRMK